MPCAWPYRYISIDNCRQATTARAPLSHPGSSVRGVVKLHVDKLTTGRGVWTETVVGDLREGKEYARFEVEPGVEVRIRYIGGELIAETRTPQTTYVIKSTPPPWRYRKG